MAGYTNAFLIMALVTIAVMPLIFFLRVRK